MEVTFNLDVQALAEAVADQAGDDLAERIAANVSAREIADYVDANEVARALDLWDVCRELDLREIAGNVDTDAVAEAIDLDALASRLPDNDDVETLKAEIAELRMTVAGQLADFDTTLKRLALHLLDAATVANGSPSFERDLHTDPLPVTDDVPTVSPGGSFPAHNIGNGNGHPSVIWP